MTLYKYTSDLETTFSSLLVPVAKWTNTLSEPHYLLGLTGWRPAEARDQIRVAAWVVVGRLDSWQVCYEINFSDRYRGSACVLSKLWQVPPLKLRHYGGIQMRILLLLLYYYYYRIIVADNKIRRFPSCRSDNNSSHLHILRRFQEIEHFLLISTKWLLKMFC